MTSLFKFNEENKKCLNCQSDKFIKRYDKNISFYLCLNCGYQEVDSFSVIKIAI